MELTFAPIDLVTLLPVVDLRAAVAAEARARLAGGSPFQPPVVDGVEPLAREGDLGTVGGTRLTHAWVVLKSIHVPARVASSARQLTLDLPAGWRQAWTRLFTHACGPPPALSRPDYPAGDGTTQKPMDTPAQGRAVNRVPQRHKPLRPETRPASRRPTPIRRSRLRLVSPVVVSETTIGP